MSDESKKPDFYDLLRSSPAAVQAILRGLQSISSKVRDGSDIRMMIDSDRIYLASKKSELYVYYVKESDETASVIAVYKKRISENEVMFKRGKIELPRHLAGQIFEAVKEIAEALEFGNVTINIIAEVFSDVIARVNQFLSEQPEAGGSGSQAAQDGDEASGDEA
jgi:hypothetical protein